MTAVAMMATTARERIPPIHILNCRPTAISSQQFKMSLGAVQLYTTLAILAIVVSMTISSVGADEKWGYSEGKVPDNRFVVGNWKHRNEGRRDIESPLALFRKRLNLPAVKIMGENLTRLVGKKGKKVADETAERWGESAGEGVDNSFQIGRLMRNNIAEENKLENGNYDEEMLELSFHRMSRYGALLTAPMSMVCGNSSDSPKGCMVTLTRLAGAADSNFSCYCNVTTNSRVASEDCCHYACCNHIQHFTNVACGNSSNPYDCDDTSVFVQDPSIAVMTESTIVTESTNVTESKIVTESTTKNTLDSTTVADGGSTPNRGDHVLGSVAAAILIFIHIRGQAQFP